MGQDTSMSGPLHVVRHIKKSSEKVWPWEQMERKKKGRKRRKKTGLGRRSRENTWGKVKNNLKCGMAAFSFSWEEIYGHAEETWKQPNVHQQKDQNLHLKQRCWPVWHLSCSIAWCPFCWDWHSQKFYRQVVGQTLKPGCLHSIGRMLG